jgi:hypothetical protein
MSNKLDDFIKSKDKSFPEDLRQICESVESLMFFKISRGDILIAGSLKAALSILEDIMENEI